MHKIRLEGDHQTLTCGLLQLVDTMQPGGAKVNMGGGGGGAREGMHFSQSKNARLLNKYS